MDKSICDLVEAAMISVSAAAGVAASIWGIAKYNYLAKKSDNDTYVQRKKADMEVMNREQELLSDPNYQSYLRGRDELRRLAIEKDAMVRLEETKNPEPAGLDHYDRLEAWCG